MKMFKIDGEVFYYEKIIDDEEHNNYFYDLYDKNGKYIVGAIYNFKGVKEIAKAFLTGSKEELYKTIDRCCF